MSSIKSVFKTQNFLFLIVGVFTLAFGYFFYLGDSFTPRLLRASLCVIVITGLLLNFKINIKKPLFIFILVYGVMTISVLFNGYGQMYLVSMVLNLIAYLILAIAFTRYAISQQFTPFLKIYTISLFIVVVVSTYFVTQYLSLEGYGYINQLITAITFLSLYNIACVIIYNYIKSNNLSILVLGLVVSILGGDFIRTYVFFMLNNEGLYMLVGYVLFSTGMLCLISIYVNSFLKKDQDLKMKEASDLLSS